MNAANLTKISKSLAIVSATILGGLVLIAPAAAEDSGTAADEARVSVVTQIARGGRDGNRGASVRHEFSALTTEGQRTATSSQSSKGSQKTQSGKSGESSTTAATSVNSGSNDFWFYDADVVLFGDDDADGYFYGIDLLFDADTVFNDVDVYAVVFLSLQGGPWNEYAVTDDFVISGASADDEYVIVTELETGYPAADYDILIELYDAIDGSFLASFGPDESSELYYLPLEDLQRDTPIVDTIVVVGHGGGHGGGNGFGLLLLLGVPLLRLMRQGADALPGRDV